MPTIRKRSAWAVLLDCSHGNVVNVIMIRKDPKAINEYNPAGIALACSTGTSAKKICKI